MNSLRRSFVAPRTAEPSSPANTVLALARFGIGVVLLSLAFSLFVLPWVHLSWVKVVRRCVSISAAITLWWCITKVERRSFQSYGLGPFREGKRHLRFGLLLGLSALAVLAVLGLATGVYTIVISPDRVKLWRTLVGFIPAMGVVGLLEELVFRGYILQHLLAISRSLAVIVSSALYSVVHVKSPTWTMMSWMELIGLFLLGVVLSLSALQTRQLYVAIGLHAALAYGARVNKLLIAVQESSMDWLVGTSRLINGVASWVVLLVIAVIILGWSHSLRRGGVQHGDA